MSFKSSCYNEYDIKNNENMCRGLSVIYQITTRRSTIDVRKKIGPVVHPNMSDKYGTGLNLVKWLVNPCLETWDVEIIHIGGTRICVTVQWITVDHMTLPPAELNLILTAVVNSCAMTGDSQTQSRTIASVHPLHYFATKGLTRTVFHNKNLNERNLMFGCW